MNLNFYDKRDDFYRIIWFITIIKYETNSDSTDSNEIKVMAIINTLLIQL